VAQEDDPLERLHRFVVDYHRFCRPVKKGRSKRNAPLALAEFAQQLMTAHPQEATRAYAPLVALFDEVLAHAVEAGVVRADLSRRRVAGVVLEAIMFNSFSTTIVGVAEKGAPDPAEELWDLILNGIGG
jgi:AcrR family transcriptional regulator